MPRFEDYHRTVVGFHGTTRKTAERIVREGKFRPSQNDYDWLGHGIYFWEYGPQQAYKWARERHSSKTDIAVLGSMIRLGNCFDLLDPDNVKPLLKAKESLVQTLGRVPVNRNSHKYLDCAVFQYFYQITEDNDERVDTARAVYVPTEAKKRLWERSWLYRETHVQLCVRNPANILGTWIVRPLEEKDGAITSHK